MAKQQKPPLPNAFEQARNTGKIGGAGKKKDPATTNSQTQETINPENQGTVNTGLQETIDTGKNEVSNQLPNVQPQQAAPAQQETQETINTGLQKSVDTGKNERIKKQTFDLPISLAKRLKNHATDREENMKDTVIRAIEKLLAEEQNL